MKRRSAAANAYDSRRRDDADLVAASLGPSNDDSPAVQVEMRAAELEDTEHWGPASVSVYERWGFMDHKRNDEGDASDVYASTDEYHAGFLSAEIESHETRDDRDATAWAWRIDRPIAVQLAETAAPEREAEALGALSREQFAARLNNADVALLPAADDAAADALVDETAADAIVAEINEPDGVL